MDDVDLNKTVQLLKSNQLNTVEPVVHFVLPKRFIHKVILACHDDNGHLGME